MRDAIDTAAKILGNTPAVCKRSYIDPAVFAHYEAGTTFAIRAIRGMTRAECMIAAMLAARTRRRSVGPRQRRSASPHPTAAAALS